MPISSTMVISLHPKLEEETLLSLCTVVLMFPYSYALSFVASVRIVEKASRY